MVEFSPRQMQILERLFAAGFRPIAIPPYESALCMRRGECAAILSTIPNGGLKLLAPPSYLVEGNLSVRLKRGAGEVFNAGTTEWAYGLAAADPFITRITRNVLTRFGALEGA